jgi:hypothetical protein
VSGDAFFWSPDEIADYPQAEFPKPNGLQLHFCCYEVTAAAMHDLPTGLGYKSDDFPVSGHGTIHTTDKVACEQVDTDQDSFLCVPGLDSLPWRFVGHFLCPGAEHNAKLLQCTASVKSEGASLITTLCHHQDTYTLEQLENLKMLVGAPDYTLDTLCTYLPAAAALDLLCGAMRQEVRDDNEMYILRSFKKLVLAFKKVICHMYLSAAMLYRLIDHTFTCTKCGAACAVAVPYEFPAAETAEDTKDKPSASLTPAGEELRPSLEHATAQRL